MRAIRNIKTLFVTLFRGDMRWRKGVRHLEMSQFRSMVEKREQRDSPRRLLQHTPHWKSRAEGAVVVFYCLVPEAKFLEEPNLLIDAQWSAA